ncbi:DNase TatD [Corynebacterium urogenitale]|uniref:DNase TatD n=1 Tax=Corynebacterium urogenitale TaxID=2487892 RepID=A0A5J6Z4B8_9CORY|nr:TatD family hydrolase [Corynebacterium urogenitale]QFQ01906.1 DNase TatD [Corynebacterium urogenitale]
MSSPNSVGASHGSAPGLRVVAQTLKPSEYVALIDQAPTIAQLAGIELGSPAMPLWSLGFHPWQIESKAQAERELAVFDQCLSGGVGADQGLGTGATRFIGEIGLDFAPRRLEQAGVELQKQVLRRILKTVCDAAKTSSSVGSTAHSPTNDDARPYILSIHAVRSATAVLDLLEEQRVTEHNVAPIIHWFSGTSDELTRLVRLGGYVSVNPRMLETKRGRAYVKQVPSDRLLLETDMPASPVTSGKAQTASAESVAQQIAREIRDTLANTLERISEIRGRNTGPDIERLQHRLFGK